MLGLICPVYNEAENIGPLMDTLANEVRVPAQLTVVYDFDEDTTLPVVRRRAEDFPIQINLLRNKYGRGVVGAVKSGLEDSYRMTAAAVIMGDLSDRLSDLNQMYASIENGTYDVVCGSRYMRGGKQIGGPPLKSFLSRMAGLTLHWLAGLPTHDATSNFKMYRGSFLAATPVESKAGFEIGLELVVKAYVGGYRVGEVPTVWTDRVAGESRFKLLEWIPHYLKWYAYAFRPRRRLKRAA